MVVMVLRAAVFVLVRSPSCTATTQSTTMMTAMTMMVTADRSSNTNYGMNTTNKRRISAIQKQNDFFLYGLLLLFVTTCSQSDLSLRGDEV
jgi:hypothetical protein